MKKTKNFFKWMEMDGNVRKGLYMVVNCLKMFTNAVNG